MCLVELRKFLVESDKVRAGFVRNRCLIIYHLTDLFFMKEVLLRLLSSSLVQINSDLAGNVWVVCLMNARNLNSCAGGLPLQSMIILTHD